MIIKEHLYITAGNLYSSKSKVRNINNTIFIYLCIFLYIIYIYIPLLFQLMSHLGQRTSLCISHVAEHRAATHLYGAFAGI